MPLSLTKVMHKLYHMQADAHNCCLRKLQLPLHTSTELHHVMQGCNFAHVLGLYRMSDEAGEAFYLRSRGALADMLLWAIFRLQTRVFASNTYIKCASLPLSFASGPILTSLRMAGLQHHPPDILPPVV